MDLLWLIDLFTTGQSLNCSLDLDTLHSRSLLKKMFWNDEPEQTGCSKIRGVWLLWCDVMIRLSSYHRFRFVVSTGERSVITLTPLCTTSNGVNPVYFEGLDFSFDISWGWISDITHKSGKFVLISIRCCAAWMPSIFEELNCCTPRAIRGTGISWIPKYAAFL